MNLIRSSTPTPWTTSPPPSGWRCWTGADSSRPKPRLYQRRAAFLRRQRLEKRLHGGALFARRHQREIIVLFGQRNEAEAGGGGDRGDGHAPIGAMLRHGGGHRVMRTRLVPVAVGTGISEQAADQDPRARALVAVDHDAGGVGERRAHRVLRGGQSRKA